MAKISFDCAYCGKKTETERGAFNRAKRKGLNVYCGRKCSGLGRRKEITEAEFKERKRLYDMERRKTQAAKLKKQKAEYHRRTYDPVKAAIERKKKMPRHVEYCRRPEYREKKREYDKGYRAKTEHGEFWEAAIVLREIKGEIATRISRYEIYQQNGTLNKKLQRRKDYDRFNSNKS